MVIDHVGTVFFPDQEIWKIIGRLCLPIFAYLIAVGYKHTRSVKKYIIRLIIFGIISQPLYMLALKINGPNIFLTLALGLIAIYLYEWLSGRTKSKILGFYILFFVAILGLIIRTDAGFYGVLCIFFFWFFDKDKDFYKLFISQTVLAMLFVLSISGNVLLGKEKFDISVYRQIFAVLSLFIIKFYNGERGKSFKYGFYLFYPGHLLILWLISYFLK